MKPKETIRKLIDLKPNTVKKLKLAAAKKDTNVKCYIQNLIEKHFKNGS